MPRFSSRKALMAQPSTPRKTRKQTRALTLEQELGQLFDRLADGTPKGLKALRLRLGLTGVPPATLAAAGSAAGLTRERVRQIEIRFIKILQKDQPSTPVLDEALQVLTEIVPATDLEVERVLAEKGLTREGFSLKSLLNAASLLGKPAVFAQALQEDGNHQPGSELPQRFVFSQARGLTLRWGASTFEVLVTELAKTRAGNPDPALARLHLDAMPSFEWLDEEQEWFWVKNAPPRNRLLDQVDKIMSVAGSIEIGELRAGVARHPRMEGFRPTREVLARMCVQSGRYRRQGNWILQGTDRRPWDLVLGPSAERKIVRALFGHGPLMRSEDLARIVAGKGGISTHTLLSHLRYSPVIERYAPGVYGLRGARVAADQAAALIPPRVRHQRLLDHRWSEDGRAWLACPVYSDALSSGTLALPPALWGRLRGSYSLTSDRGWDIGTIVVNESHIRELGPFFRRWGIEEGDYVLLNLDVARGLATVTSGTEELLLRFQPGE